MYDENDKYLCQNWFNGDVVEEIKNLLVISKADHIEDLESLVDESDKWLK